VKERVQFKEYNTEYNEEMERFCGCCRWESSRAAKRLLTKGSVKRYRISYQDVKKKFRRMGLDGVMLYKQKLYSMEKGYEYCDMGWVLEDNVLVIRLVEMMGSTPSKTYTIFEKKIVWFSTVRIKKYLA